MCSAPVLQMRPTFLLKFSPTDLTHETGYTLPFSDSQLWNGFSQRLTTTQTKTFPHVRNTDKRWIVGKLKTKWASRCPRRSSVYKTQSGQRSRCCVSLQSQIQPATQTSMPEFFNKPFDQQMEVIWCRKDQASMFLCLCLSVCATWKVKRMMILSLNAPLSADFVMLQLLHSGRSSNCKQLFPSRSPLIIILIPVNHKVMCFHHGVAVYVSFETYLSARVHARLYVWLLSGRFWVYLQGTHESARSDSHLFTQLVCEHLVISHDTHT